MFLQELWFPPPTIHGLTMQEHLGRIRPEPSRQIPVLLQAVIRKTACPSCPQLLSYYLEKEG